VAALILLEDDTYLLQHRDDVPWIWYPDHWGCFGGALEPGEEPLAALRRELHEELELEVRDAEYFTRIDFDLTTLGGGPCSRTYYVIRLGHAERGGLVLHEGRAMGSFPGAVACRDLRVTPYDAFALFLHHSRDRVGSRHRGGGG
jgi:8-oxo-dGTP pyrophosphatase MutT (NUDIX family)